MQKNNITNKITPCCGLPFSVMYWWISNLTLNTEADRQYIISKLSQNGILRVDAWKVLINSGTLEADASLTKAEFLAWFDCERQPYCEQLKLIIEGYKIGNWTADGLFPYVVLNKTFSSELKFDKAFTIMQISQTADLTFTINDENQIPMGANYIRLVSDGVHNVELSAFKKQSGSADFKKENGVLNVLCLYYDGIDYWVNIWQEVAILPPHVFVESLTDFTQNFGATQNATTKVITGGTSTGAYSAPIEFYDGAEIWSENSADASILGISLTNENLFVWQPNNSNLLMSLYQYTGVTYAARRGTIGTNSPVSNVAQINGSFAFKKIRRSGNSLICSVSNDGTTWTDFYTEPNVFTTANPAVYIKAQFAANGGSLKPHQKI